MTLVHLSEDFLDCFNLLAAPTEVFSRTANRDRWVVALLFFSVLSAAVAFFQNPLERIAAEKAIGESLPRAATSQALLWVLYLVSLLSILVRSFVISALIWIALTTIHPHHRATYAKIFSMVIYSEGIFSLMKIVSVLILYAKGANAIHGPEDLKVPFGIDLIFSTSKPQVGTIIQNLNLFSLWYIFTMSIGIMIHTGSSRVKALVVAASAWFLWISGGIVVPHVFHNFVKTGVQVR
jgi:hypothetical protein